MHLSPREMDKLLLHGAGVLAQKRLARGLRLNYPESVALIAAQLLELVRDGKSVAELMDVGRRMLGKRHVVPGVPELVAEVQIEGTFPDGSKLVTVHNPIATEEGDLNLCLYGSFLPVPSADAFPPNRPSENIVPGEIFHAPGQLTLNEDRPSLSLAVVNLGDRPIQVGSHYHFSETNRALSFDRALAYGMRLDIPSGTAVRFEPGESKTVQLTSISGTRVVRGGNLLAEGPISEEMRASIPDRAEKHGFAHRKTTP